VIASVNHPPINLDATKFTVKLGDRNLPPFSDAPAWMALASYLATILGPIEPGN
jgi:hypothetical protein